ncbi:MAG: hypothetical protein WCO68_10910 [Verrucomicrobiota bacterium]
MNPSLPTSQPALLEVEQSRQTLHSRLFWFFVGAGVSYLFIATPFKYLKVHTDLSVAAISACSVGLSTVFFFVWNYFINFRSDARRRDALARYLVAVLVLWALSSTTLTLLKHFDFHFALSLLGRFPIDLDIVATQCFIGGFKFLVYHRWVFPVSKS